MATHCKHCGHEIWQKVPSATADWEHCETGSQLCYDYPGAVKAEPVIELSTTRRQWREDSVKYINEELGGLDRPIVFGCDDCGAVNACEYAFDPYNMDGDCLAEK